MSDAGLSTLLQLVRDYLDVFPVARFAPAFRRLAAFLGAFAGDRGFAADRARLTMLHAMHPEPE